MGDNAALHRRQWWYSRSPVKGACFYRESFMSAVAEPILYGTIDDGLARRNAMVLAVAQALAGGNNTVIVSTACDRRRRAGARQGTGDAADHRHGDRHVVRHVAGRRARPPLWPPLRAADRIGIRRSVRADFLFRRDERPVLAAADRHLLRRTLCRRASTPTASPPPIPRAKRFGRRWCPGFWPAASSPR